MVNTLQSTLYHCSCHSNALIKLKLVIKHFGDKSAAALVGVSLVSLPHCGKSEHEREMETSAVKASRYTLSLCVCLERLRR